MNRRKMLNSIFCICYEKIYGESCSTIRETFGFGTPYRKTGLFGQRDLIPPRSCMSTKHFRWQHATVSPRRATHFKKVHQNPANYEKQREYSTPLKWARCLFQLPALILFSVLFEMNCRNVSSRGMAGERSFWKGSRTRPYVARTYHVGA